MPSSDVVSAALSDLQTLHLLAKLESLLPYTIPLTRRIQCHVRAPMKTRGVDVQASIDKWLSSSTTVSTLKDPQSPWIAAFVDLSSPGTTQGWIFGSWELPLPSDTQPPIPSALYQALVHSLFNHIHTSLVPRMPISPPASWLWLRDNGKWVSQPFSRSKVLFGTLHEGVRALIDDRAVARVDARYSKYIFPQGRFDGETPDGKAEQAFGLAAGYRFGTLGESELQRVLDGTPIPRTLAYLKEVVNAGVYHHGEGAEGKGELIAYAFLGKDGSLGGLDVNTAHRGKGVAGALAGELFRRQASTFSYSAEGSGREEREGWFYHADVGEDNGASRRVMEKLLGEVMWRVCWVEVDLDVVLGEKERARDVGDERRLDGVKGGIRGKGR